VQKAVLHSQLGGAVKGPNGFQGFHLFSTGCYRKAAAWGDRGGGPYKGGGENAKKRKKPVQRTKRWKATKMTVIIGKRSQPEASLSHINTLLEKRGD